MVFRDDYFGGIQTRTPATEQSTERPTACERCGAPLPLSGPGSRGRPRRFCSDSCVSLHARDRSIRRRGESLAADEPALSRAIAAVSSVESSLDMLRRAIDNAIVNVRRCLAPYPEAVWAKVLLAASGKSKAIESLIESFEHIHWALAGLLASFQLADLLDCSVLESLLPDPGVLPPCSEDAAGNLVPGRCALVDCQHPLPSRSGPGRPPRYCSARCRELDHLRRRRLQVAAEERKRLIAEASGWRAQLIEEATVFTNTARRRSNALLAFRDACPVPRRGLISRDAGLPVRSPSVIVLTPGMTEQLRQWLMSLQGLAKTSVNARIPFPKEPWSECADTQPLVAPAASSTPLEEWSDIVAEATRSLASATDQLRRDKAADKGELLRAVAEKYEAASSRALNRLAPLAPRG